LEESKEKSWEQIQGYIQGMKPFEFKILVGDLLRAMDYHVAWVAPPDKDRGKIDIVAYTDPLGVSPPRIIVQVKHKGQATTVEGLRGFVSVLGVDDFGLLISSGGFTNDAKEEALAQKNHKVALIDLEGFFDLWVEHYEKFAPEARLRFPLEPVHFLSPLE
jgi:restriction system protein